MAGREPAVSLDELVAAMFFVSAAESCHGAEDVAYLHRPTGTVHWHSVEDIVGELYDEPLPENVTTLPDYLRIPNKRELDLGKALVFAFVHEFMPYAYAEVAAIFRKRGAYGRFRSILENRGLLGQWRQFQDAGEKEAMRSWCQKNGVALKE
jgi:hypothetical protein